MADVFTVLRQIRFRKSMTQGEIAARAGIAQSYSEGFDVDVEEKEAANA